MTDEHRPAIYPPPEDVERYEAAAPGLTAQFVKLVNDVSAREHRETMVRQFTYSLAVVSLVVITLATLFYAWKVQDSATTTVIAIFVTYWIVGPTIDAVLRRFAGCRTSSQRVGLGWTPAPRKRRRSALVISVPG